MNAALWLIAAMSWQEESALLERALQAPAVVERLRALKALGDGGSARALNELLKRAPKADDDPTWPLLLRYTSRAGRDEERTMLCAVLAERGIHASWALGVAQAFTRGALSPCIKQQLSALTQAGDEPTLAAALEALLAHPGATLPYERLVAIMQGGHAVISQFRAVSLLARQAGAPLAAQRAVLAHATAWVEDNPNEGMPEEHWRALKAMSGKDLPRVLSRWKAALATTGAP